MRGDPLRDPTRTRVVGGEGEFARAALVLDQLTQERRAELGVERRIDDQAGVVELDAGAPRGHGRGRGNICISPFAPAPEFACQMNSLSCRATA